MFNSTVKVTRNSEGHMDGFEIDIAPDFAIESRILEKYASLVHFEAGVTPKYENGHLKLSISLQFKDDPSTAHAAVAEDLKAEAEAAAKESAMKQ